MFGRVFLSCVSVVACDCCQAAVSGMFSEELWGWFPGSCGFASQADPSGRVWVLSMQLSVACVLGQWGPSGVFADGPAGATGWR